VKLRPLAYCVLATVSSASAAHDFWIQPLQWQNSGEVAVTLQVGHGNDRQRSPVEVSRIVLVKSILADGQRVDLHPRLNFGETKSDFSTGASGGPPVMVALATDANAESHLDPERFKFHLQGEGLAEAIAWRAEHNLSNSEGSENHGRVAKMLLAAPADRSVALKPLGLDLEIVPLADPYAAGVERLPVQALFEGSPLNGATIKLYDLSDDIAPKAVCLTDLEGKCGLQFSKHGSWLESLLRLRLR